MQKTIVVKNVRFYIQSTIDLDKFRFFKPEAYILSVEVDENDTINYVELVDKLKNIIFQNIHCDVKGASYILNIADFEWKFA